MERALVIGEIILMSKDKDAKSVISAMAIEPTTEESQKPVPVTFDDFSRDLTERLIPKPKAKMDFILWTFPNGQEIAFHKAVIPLDAQEYEYKGKRYIIDRDKIKNRLGVLTYDHTVNDTVGALSFIKKTTQAIDAKNYAEGVRRNWFTALWGTWKLPFIALVISMVVALVLGIVTMALAFETRDMAVEIESLKNALAQSQSNNLPPALPPAQRGN